MEFEAWVKAKGFDADKLAAESLTFLRAQYDAEIKAKSTAEQDRIAALLATAEKRRNAIAALASQYVSSGCPSQIATDLVANCNTENWPLEKLELSLLKAARPASSAGSLLNLGADAPPTQPILEAAMMMQAGMAASRLAPFFDQRTIDAATHRNVRNLGFTGLMHIVCQAAGVHVRPGRVDNDFIRCAFEADRKLQAAGFSTVSLPGTLGNQANKALIDSYTAVETTWSRFAATRSLNDFKVHTRYRLDSTGAFKKVGADGELKHAGLSEASYTNQLATYGAMLSLTRQMLINDDLGAFYQLPQLFGRMGALRIEEAVYVLLLSNPSSFFASGNNNYMSGGTTALSISALTTAKQKFMDQVDSNGKPVLVRPVLLLIGTVLDKTAWTILSSELIVSGNTTAAPNKNPHPGTLDYVASTYVNNTAVKDQDGSAITGQSSTAWYLFADPVIRAAIAVAFLNGQQMPTIENAETDFSSLGMQWRCFHDFGVGMEDTVAAVLSAGA